MALFLVASITAPALDIRNCYSPRDKERARRKGTDLIVLHTTEGEVKGALNKIRTRGEAHYVVDTVGKVYRIIHHDRVAYHAGRSMWNGRTELDAVSLGVEVVGYHNRSLTKVQEAALRELIVDLQRMYRVPDNRVLPHSMVAYGAPNQWHKKSHRGRKRCGMLFARTSLRRRLGLDSEPTYDPDVRAGRLVVADPYLESQLYGARGASVARKSSEDGMVIAKGRSAWDIARDRYASADTVYVYPNGTRVRGNAVKDWSKIPAGTKVVLGASEQGP
jgi:hypothetical protein